MRVYVNSPNHSDAGSSMGHYAEALARAFAQDGMEVVLCSSRPSRLGDDQVSVPPKRLTRVNRINMLLLYREITRHIRRTAPRDYAIVNISHEFIYPRQLKRSLVIIHDTIQMEYPRSRLVRPLLRISWALARRIAERVCDSIATKTDLAALGIDAQVIYVPFERERFLAFEPAGVTKTHDAIWCGTLAFHKNIAAYLELARRHPDRRFAAILPAGDAAALQERPANLDVLTGLGADAYLQALASARLLISTSRKEGYGMPAMEAMMLGTPALLSDIAVYRELYGKVGHFFPLDDADAFSRAFEAVVDLPVPADARDRWMPDLLPSQGSYAEFVAPVRRIEARAAG